MKISGVNKKTFENFGLRTFRFFVPMIIGFISIGASNPFKNTEDKLLDDIFLKMKTTINSIKSAKYYLKNIERIGTEYMNGHQFVHCSTKPKKSYVRFISPNEGAELVYIEGENDSNAVYNPNGFPYFKLRLDPYGSLMRKNNHHTIHEIGFGYIGKLLAFYFNNNRSSFKISGEKVWEGKSCWKVNVFDPKFNFINYKVKKGETTNSLANRLFINEYLLVERNENVDGFGELEEGTTIKIPNSYAKNIVLLIEKESGLPLYIEINDDKGLLESYKYYNVQLNTRITASDFSFKNLKFSF